MRRADDREWGLIARRWRDVAGAGRAAADGGARAAARRPAQRGQRARRAGACARDRACRLAPLLQALREFEGLPHRVQKVAEIGGVAFYDDSKGTNVGATVAALERPSTRPVVLIAGGDGKGQDFAPLAPAVASARARGGADRPRCATRSRAALAGSGVPRRARRDMEEAVQARVAARARRATRCCCRRPARASTCSATTGIAARCSPRRCERSETAAQLTSDRCYVPPPDAPPPRVRPRAGLGRRCCCSRSAW